MPSTFRQLEVFLEAAEDCNFRKTADRIGISQPAISKHIRALEKSLGARVFERTRGAAAQLSADGVALVDVARGIVEQRRTLKVSRGGDEPHIVRIAARSYVLDTFIKPALTDFYLRHPDVIIEVEEVNDSQDIVRRLRDGRCDLGIYTEDSQPVDARYSEVLNVLPYSLYASPQVAEIVGTDVDLISAQPFVVLNDLKFGEWIRRNLRQVGIVPRGTLVRVQFGSTIGALVADGRGVAILLDGAVPEAQRDKLVRIPIEFGPCYRVMTKGSKMLEPSSAPVVEYLRTLFAGAARPV